MVVTAHLVVLQEVFQVRIPVLRLMQSPGLIQEQVDLGQGQVVPQTCHQGQRLRLTRAGHLHNKHHSSEEAAHHLEDQVDHPNEEGGFKKLHSYKSKIKYSTQSQKQRNFFFFFFLHSTVLVITTFSTDSMDRVVADGPRQPVATSNHHTVLLQLMDMGHHRQYF